jgi:hypothetical protein
VQRVPASTRIQGEIKMRTFILAVAAIAATSWAIDQARAAEQVPAFNIVRNCNAEAASVGNEIADCAKDETDAKNELGKRWSEFNTSDK